MKIGTDIILPYVYALTFENQYDLCMSFLRLQEFYESQKFKDKYFTLEEFMDYWSKEFGNGSFDYPAKWNGFNLPSDVIKKWLDVFFWRNDIRSKEIELLNAIRYLMKQEANGGSLPQKYYVIGVHSDQSSKNNNEAIEHESAHALYYLYPEYRKSCDAMIEKTSRGVIDKAEKTLKDMGYGKNVVKDELQAYFSTNDVGKGLIITLRGRKEFVQNFKKFKEGLKNGS